MRAELEKKIEQSVRLLKSIGDTHPNVKVVTDFDFRDEYEQMYMDLFCDSLAQYRDEIEDLWGRFPTKECLEFVFKIDL